MKIEAAPQVQSSITQRLFEFDQAQKALREAQANLREAEFDLKQQIMEQKQGHLLKLDPVAVKHAIREARGVR